MRDLMQRMASERFRAKVFFEQLRQEPDLCEDAQYMAWLRRHHPSGPMQRAIVRASQRFEALKPGRVRVRRVHQAYQGRRRPR